MNGTSLRDTPSVDPGVDAGTDITFDISSEVRHTFTLVGTAVSMWLVGSRTQGFGDIGLGRHLAWRDEGKKGHLGCALRHCKLCGRYDPYWEGKRIATLYD